MCATRGVVLLAVLITVAPACAKERPQMLSQAESDYARQVLRAVRENDVAWIGSNITYPICGTNPAGKPKRSESRADFLNVAPILLSAEFRQAVKLAEERELLKNWRGVGVAGGLIWFDYVAGGYRIVRANAPSVVDCEGHSGVGE